MQKSKLNIKFKNFKFWIVILVFGIWILDFIGCATAPYISPPKPEIAMPGIYHRVSRGETLWRISKIYDVDLDEIVRINRIPDAASIEIGQLIFIPRRQQRYLTYKSSSYPDDFIWPIKGKVISLFGQTYNNMVNKGINIQPYKYDEDVVASRNGRVVFYADDFEGFGKTVIIEHGDGFSTVYARNSQVFIKVGDNVKRGAIIAKAGSAARDKNTYLHFEIRKGHIPKNPYFYLPN